MRPTSKFLIIFLIVTCITTIISCDNKRSLKEVEYSDIDSLKSTVYKWRELGGMPDSALTYINLFYEQSAKENNYKDQVIALNTRMKYYSSRNNFDQTYKSAEEMLVVAKQSGDTKLIKSGLYALGSLHFSRGTFYDALDYYLQSINLSNDDSNERASMFYMLGQTYGLIYNSHVGDSLSSYYYDLAEEEMNKPDFNRPLVKGFVLFGKGVILLQMTDKNLYEFPPMTKQRSDSLKLAVKLMEGGNTYFDQGIIVNNCAISFGYAMLGDHKNTRKYEQIADSLAKEKPEEISTVYYTMGLNSFIEKRFSDAIKISEKGYKNAISNGQQSNGAKNAKVVANSYKAINDFANAYKYQSIQIALEDSMRQSEKQDQMMVHQVKYDIKLKDEKLEEAKVQNESYKQRIIFISAISTIIFVILCIIFILYQQKRKAYHMLVEKNIQWADKTYVSKTTNEENEANDEENIEEIKPLEKEAKQQPDNISDDSNKENIKALMNAIYDKIESDKLYRNNNLSLDMLASMLNTNKNYVSRAINLSTGVNFKTLISEYRIKEAIKMIKHQPIDKSFDSISDECGFNDRTTFYRSFKKITGLSPSEFKQNL